MTKQKHEIQFDDHVESGLVNDVVGPEGVVLLLVDAFSIVEELVRAWLDVAVALSFVCLLCVFCFVVF